MADVQTTSDSYCPQCGRPLKKSQEVRLGGESSLHETFVGAYESDDAHLVLDGGTIRLFEHDVQEEST